MVPLGLLFDGEVGEVVSLNNPLSKTYAQIMALGVRKGKMVEILTQGAKHLLIKVDESRLAIDRKTAMGIWVRRSPCA